MEKKQKLLKNYAGMLLIAAAVFGLDQWTKLWIRNHLALRETITPIPAMGNFFRIIHWKNTGIAFGLFQGLGVLFIVLTVLLSVILVLLIYKLPSGKHYLPLNIIFTLILGGALGNLWDRIFQSYVTDFIYIRLINFPIFNVADICVSLGIVALLFYLLFFYKDSELKELFAFRRKKEESSKAEDPEEADNDGVPEETEEKKEPEPGQE